MKLQFIVNELKNVFEGTPWYGNSVSTYLQAITPNLLNYRQNNSHSIGQIIEHMIIWREFVVDKLNGDHTQLEVGNSEDWRGKIYVDADLFQLFARIKDSQKALITILSDKKDELLQQQVENHTYDFGYLLCGLIQHDIYHLGQLYMLAKMAKNEIA